ncbi:hypothetical protein ACFQU2_02475 [Siccirubricoccus deserti]
MPDRRRHGEAEDRGHGGARAERGINAKDRLIATMPRWAPYAAMAPWVANARGWVPGLATLTEKLLGFAAERRLPRFRADAFHDAELPAPDGREGEVILLPDLFNRYFEPENLRAAARVLNAAGYRPTVARPRAAPGRWTRAAPCSPPGWWRRRGPRRAAPWRRCRDSAAR